MLALWMEAMAKGYVVLGIHDGHGTGAALLKVVVETFLESELVNLTIGDYLLTKKG